MHRPVLRARPRRLAATVLALALCGLSAPAASLAGVANAGLSTSPNPLAGMTWGGYHSPTPDPTNDPPSAYFNLRHDPRLVPYLEVPRFRWFGSWVQLHDTGHGASFRWGVYRTIRSYIRTVTGGNRDIGVQIGIFRLEPFEKAVRTRVPSRGERASYRHWIDKAVRAIRDAHARVALVMQPDLPESFNQPDGGRVQLGLVKWAVKRFNGLPHTTVYLDGGSSDWLRAGRASTLLRRAGAAYTRGFALNLTHYDTTGREAAYGRRVVRDLARHGVRNQHFVVSTAMNGHGFTVAGHRATFHHGTLCSAPGSRSCVTLGQPFTTSTATPLADAYAWAGRGWYQNATVRTYPELLRLLQTSPFF